MSVQASVVVNSVRDAIPDPVYNSSGTALPDTDGGLFRAQTLYRWLNDGVKLCAELIGWRVVDWLAIAKVSGQPNYSIDSRWSAISDLLVNKWVLAPLDESLSIYPTAELSSAQPIRYGTHKTLDQLYAFIFPTPNSSDPATTLTTAVGSSGSPTFTVGSTTNWLPDGYFQIDSEIIKYESITTTTVTNLTRGQCGTTAAAHTAGTAVTHLSIWIKGPRMPAEIGTATDVIELPSAFIPMLNSYLLSRCRQAEQEYQESRALMKDFNDRCERFRSDPYWQSLDSQNVQPYDAPFAGPLAWNRVIVP